ncbi:MGH1-like glycoside hydrolase domain-containing protein [Rarobacter incanus]|uniref:Mannosylglycerate hydrolase MGH1-like glycoside hydrolase domain-containing protein n=1 Tax=Rarobacter incanus TaxID=153494 RepID=A0A542SLD7_9MICO|nr:hypothetical protein [Rarobacter incanus]TQK75451.1 hypothetical protein FB389_0078 [Rarobacter incanus]
MHRRTRERTVALGAGIAVAFGGLATSVAAPAAQAHEVSSAAACQSSPKTGQYSDGVETATVKILATDPVTCLRTYSLSSDRSSAQTFTESADDPIVRTGSTVLDGLYAFALHEEKLLRKDSITTDNYNGGQTISCNPSDVDESEQVGCYITGKNWTYIWTRDLSYASDLGMASIDPIRMRNTLEFKLSERRTDGFKRSGESVTTPFADATGSDLQIIQDTGTGGSYPNSTDRVSWALGAEELLKWLPQEQREAFAAKSLEAVKNTIDHDRQVVFNTSTGLYTGETSFLDWRQQTYPDWTGSDVIDITDSQSLSTNITHWYAIDLVAKLSQAAGNEADATKYRGWADTLAQTIRDRFWLAERGQFSAVVGTTLNPVADDRYDALATSFAVLSGIATQEQAAQAIANYPQTFTGPSVIWPQQQFDGSYHNDGSWPFVTVYMLRAAAAVANDTAATRQFESMLRTPAIFGSNYENMNITTTETNTRLNSKYQTWSVAGFHGMFQDVLFGVHAQDDGLKVNPFVTAQIRDKYFADSDSITMSNIIYLGKKVTIKVDLPESAATAGAYAVTGLEVDGATVAVDSTIAAGDLSDDSTIEVSLGDAKASKSAAPITDTKDDEALYGPKTPSASVSVAESGSLQLTVGLAGEKQNALGMDIVRDGKVIARGLDASTQWVDQTSNGKEQNSYCYVVRTYYKSSGNASQDSKPACYWGPENDRVITVDAADFTNVTTGAVAADTTSTKWGGDHYYDFGNDLADEVTAQVTPTVSGDYLLRANYAKGGDLRNGVDSGIKRVSVTEDGSDTAVSTGFFMMPRTDGWSNKRDSTFVKAHLEAGKTYNIKVYQDALSVNMSYFEANRWHNEQTGGASNVMDIFSVSASLKTADEAPALEATDGGSQTFIEQGSAALVKVQLAGTEAAAAASKAVTVTSQDGTEANLDVTKDEGADTYTAAGSIVLGAVGRQTLTVKVDGQPVLTLPVTVRALPTAVVAPTDPDGEAGWYTTTPTVTVTPAALTTAQIRFNGGTWQAAEGAVAVPDGEDVNVEVRAVDAGGSVGAVTTVATLDVDATAPTLSTDVTNDGVTATVVANATDASSGIAAIEYRLPGSNTWVAESAGVRLALKTTKQKVEIRAIDVAGNVSQVFTVAVPLASKNPAASGSVSVVGIVAVGSQVVAYAKNWGSGTSLRYQWYADGKAIAGATGDVLTIAAAHQGKQLSVTVTGTAGDMAAVTKTAKASAWKISAGTVKITGKRRAGAKLKAVVKDFDPAKVTYTYRWYAGGKAIKKATKKTFKVKKAQRGKKIIVKVTAKRAGFASVTKKSKAVKIKK